MKKTIFLFSIVVVTALAACMTPPPRSGDHMVSNQQTIPEESERIQALLDAGKNFSLVITVPAANNMLSNGVSTGVLKIGSGSAPADSLLDILRGEKEQTIAVVGKSDMLTASTIKTAIQQLNGNPTATTILFAGAPKYVKKLQRLADKANVPFEGVAFPSRQKKASRSSQEEVSPSPQEEDSPSPQEKDST